MKSPYYLIVLLFLLFSTAFFMTDAFSHGFNRSKEFSDQENVSIETKEIENGLQITISSNDKETVQKIHQNVPWYKRMFSRGFGHMTAEENEYCHGRNGRYGRHMW